MSRQGRQTHKQTSRHYTQSGNKADIHKKGKPEAAKPRSRGWHSSRKKQYHEPGTHEKPVETAGRDRHISCGSRHGRHIHKPRTSEKCDYSG